MELLDAPLPGTLLAQARYARHTVRLYGTFEDEIALQHASMGYCQGDWMHRTVLHLPLGSCDAESLW